MRVCPACGTETTRGRCPDCDTRTQLSVVWSFFDRRDAGAMILDIVGESHYQVPLERLLARQRRLIQVALRPEPTNPADPNAIRVVDDDGRTLGYLSRGYAKRYVKVFTDREELRCDAVLTGGERGQSIGLRIDATELHRLSGRPPDPRAGRLKRTRQTPIGCLPRAGVLSVLVLAAFYWLLARLI